MYNIRMQFVWSAIKASQNLKKHNVSFEEAQTVFYQPTTKVAHDPEHSESEDRFLAIGYSSLSKLLIVVHCYKDEEETIRIISARKTTKTEKRQFEEGL